ncbi:hypothetical protein [Trichormus variabilis]|uniref:Uncharacterized protein n=1 Tax=Trichormus variabilis SAG 1403-4b TaxID=447716 RepID=A0A3S1BPU0_ANAVA|nr:hypothetical protein [Trichormus variabilis]MBD2629672.1 hypothetical protein [Trichormus variabilis FACHB-164]RUS92910.1 hypothetical protein DSM107003_46570 [Trichormus variabilis SAG 1403-4b]
MNPDILNNLETKINDGIGTFEELDSVCSQLLGIINSCQKTEPQLATKANELMERLRPNWSSVSFQAWVIGEIL